MNTKLTDGNGNISRDLVIGDTVYTSTLGDATVRRILDGRYIRHVVLVGVELFTRPNGESCRRAGLLDGPFYTQSWCVSAEATEHELDAALDSIRKTGSAYAALGRGVANSEAAARM